jgi:hypothetical protein
VRDLREGQTVRDQLEIGSCYDPQLALASTRRHTVQQHSVVYVCEQEVTKFSLIAAPRAAVADTRLSAG